MYVSKKIHVIVFCSLISTIYCLGADSSNTTTIKKISNDLYYYGDIRIELVKKDITTIPVDAIVSAANSTLPWPCGGIARAIYEAAGVDKLNAWVHNNAPYNKQRVRIPVGQALVSPSFNLSKRGIKYIIHAVGPNYNAGQSISLLYDTYKNSLLAADNYGITSLAFPAISTGIFGCDPQKSAELAIQAICQTVPTTSIKHIYCTSYDDHYASYLRLFLEQRMH